MLRFTLTVIAALALAGCGGGLLQPASDVPDGVAPAVWQQLTTELNSQLGKRASINFQPHLAPDEYTTVDDLTVTPLADGYLLEWSYKNFGDYNQDGEVNFSDLAKIGQYLGATSSSPNWQLASIADGDGNGSVGMEDITPLAANWRGCVGAYLLAPELGDNNGDGLISITDLSGIGILFLSISNGLVGMHATGNDGSPLRFVGPEGEDFSTNVSPGSPGVEGPWEGFFAQPILVGTLRLDGRRKLSCRLSDAPDDWPEFVGWTTRVIPVFDNGEHFPGSGGFPYSIGWDWSTVGNLSNIVTLPELAQ